MNRLANVIFMVAMCAIWWIGVTTIIGWFV